MKTSFQLNTTLDQLCTLCKTVEGLQQTIRCTDKQMFEITLIIEELCANVVNHGCATHLDVELVTNWDELVITIRDDGSPFDPTTKSGADINQPLEQRTPGGLGLHLVQHYVDSFEYKRENGNNVVILKKIL